MHSARKFFRAVLVLMSLVSATTVFGDEVDDAVPDVTDRSRASAF